MTVTRGTTNGNDRGSTYTRRRRREWLVENYRADLTAIRTSFRDGTTETNFYPGDMAQTVVKIWEPFPDVTATVQAACRCYRCGMLLTVDTVTVDRIIPGCQGGTYRRNNIRPACGSCNSITGGGTRR